MWNDISFTCLILHQSLNCPLKFRSTLDEHDHPNVSFIFIIFMEEAGKKPWALQIKGIQCNATILLLEKSNLPILLSLWCFLAKRLCLLNEKVRHKYLWCRGQKELNWSAHHLQETTQTSADWIPTAFNTTHHLQPSWKQFFLAEGSVYCQQGQGVLPLEESPQPDFRAGSFHCKPAPGCTTLLRM